MDWMEIVIHTNQEAVEAVSFLLQELGADGVAIEDPEVLHRAWENRYGEIIELSPDDYPEEGVRIKAYLSELEIEDPEALLQKVREGLEHLKHSGLNISPGTVTHRMVNENDWADEWKKYYKVSKISDRITIKPTWEEYDPSPGEKVIELDPGMAFGTGTHPTTALCIHLLEQALTPGDRVIDVGCGSGVLSIVAGKLGAEYVLALDLDPLAVEKTRENVETNHLSGVIEAREGDLLKGVGQTADLVVANILAEIIVLLVHDLPRVLKPGGAFIASGIIEEKAKWVEASLLDAGLEVLETKHQDGWVAILAKKW
ncbi:50S ribosomal protein L11 methyltransferase [Thermoactinomyces sp. CICC 10522]|uniref:50S ribosomal protein L11 methyltransferase n=1 Tax=Thermoactinomyces sp. CICC 10522 TaxID=2767427 RepID=UPI0018DCB5A8|nr:50S ribosomal protein L11 methyltransferase [Thermoactinomyces sp. CICC 10522]MBH8602934.1 50S ribosomal protein L11 methyltransferase [Thermoactinomyces sp. CICC 10522]